MRITFKSGEVIEGVTQINFHQYAGKMPDEISYTKWDGTIWFAVICTIEKIEKEA